MGNLLYIHIIPYTGTQSGIVLKGGMRFSSVAQLCPTLATSCEELTHWKRFWRWEGLGAGGKGDDRGWDAWMASRTWWTWVGMNSGSWWWTGKPGMLRFMGSQRVWHDWETDLIWSDLKLLTFWKKDRIKVCIRITLVLTGNVILQKKRLAYE